MIQRRLPIKQRIITALVLLPLLLLFIYYAGPAWFCGFVTLVAATALYEFYGMSLAGERKVEKSLAVLFGALLVPAASFGPAPALQGMLAFGVLFFGLIFLWRFLALTEVLCQLALVFFGFCYISLLLAHLVMLHGLPFGREWVFLVLLIVMASDSAAYFSGIALGRHKLYPAISPNKSIEGAIGGLLGGLVGAFVARWWFFSSLGLLDCLLLGLILGCVGQTGDLFESMIKRAFQVKDSGTIVPGHGGILDRLDSLLFTFPLAYYYGLLRF
ncbi:MAG: phosphatidate cytidylyltransferase [Syntrophotaleaceae bacterium]